MQTDTIVAAPLHPRTFGTALLTQNPRIDLLPDGDPSVRRFKIKSADSFVRRRSANLLLKSRYAWRGYQSVSLPSDQTSNRITLTATEDDAVIGTITVGLDGPEGLATEDVFADVLAKLRSEGKRLCEFTKLAVDPISGTKRVLAALFHVAYIVAHRIRSFDTLVMEVNPRHVRYYERMLGAHVGAEERLNKSVNAPSVLLVLEFAYVKKMIGEHAGMPGNAGADRTLYPFGFTLTEEAGIITKLLALQKAPSRALN
jgi:hypothetical protein